MRKVHWKNSSTANRYIANVIQMCIRDSSYATLLGGMCTLIGTSTNLVVDGMILDAGYKGFGMFEVGRVGIFIALAGVVYLLFFSSRLLPEVRKDTDVYKRQVPGNAGVS